MLAAMRRASITISLILLLLGANGCAGPTCARSYVGPAGPARAFLWEVKGEQGTIHLLGTWHGAGEKDVPAAAWQRLDAAEVYVAEVDAATRFDNLAARTALARSLELPAGQSLARMIAEADFYDLLDYLGARAEQVARLKPWVAMAMLAARAWTTPSPAIDEALLAHARARSLATEFLETWDEQVAALDAAVGGPELAQAIHEFPTMRCTLEDTYAAYRAGDDERLGGALVGDARDELLVRRNARWLPLLERQLASGRRVFVAVGVGHLLGADGLVAQLGARGFRVTRVASAE